MQKLIEVETDIRGDGYAFLTFLYRIANFHRPQKGTKRSHFSDSIPFLTSLSCALPNDR